MSFVTAPGGRTRGSRTRDSMTQGSVTEGSVQHGPVEGGLARGGRGGGCPPHRGSADQGAGVTGRHATDLSPGGGARHASAATMAPLARGRRRIVVRSLLVSAGANALLAAGVIAPVVGTVLWGATGQGIELSVSGGRALLVATASLLALALALGAISGWLHARHAWPAWWDQAAHLPDTVVTLQDVARHGSSTGSAPAPSLAAGTTAASSAPCTAGFLPGAWAPALLESAGRLPLPGFHALSLTEARTPYSLWWGLALGTLATGAWCADWPVVGRSARSSTIFEDADPHESLAARAPIVPPGSLPDLLAEPARPFATAAIPTATRPLEGPVRLEPGAEPWSAGPGTAEPLISRVVAADHARGQAAARVRAAELLAAQPDLRPLAEWLLTGGAPPAALAHLIPDESSEQLALAAAVEALDRAGLARLAEQLATASARAPVHAASRTLPDASDAPSLTRTRGAQTAPASIDLPAARDGGSDPAHGEPGARPRPGSPDAGGPRPSGAPTTLDPGIALAPTEQRAAPAPAHSLPATDPSWQRLVAEPAVTLRWLRVAERYLQAARFPSEERTPP